ncbi:MAG: amidohydrolase family protein [Desulforhopalus sp.]
MVIISAPWIVPIDHPVIENGSIVVDDGLIIDRGEREYIVQKHPQCSETWHPFVLMPGLVNAHMHLELSHLKNSIEPLANKSFTEWIDSLIALRTAKSRYQTKIIESFVSGLLDQHKSGVVLIGDIGNESYTELQQCREGSRPHILRMLEFLGPNREACQTALERLIQLDESVAATGHAPYSTAPELLVELKKRCQRLQHIFSIHTAESPDEREFLRTGTGIFRDFLVQKNSWDGAFTFSESGFPGTIEYYDHLGILDDRTMLVHCVDVTASELRLIKAREAKICLCPGSNKFLGVGLAPVEQMVAIGLMPALGSDSPASNDAVDIWREMQLLVESQKKLEHSTVLSMATIGGAKALGRDTDYGSLAVGKKAEFIGVSSAALSACSNGQQLLQELVSGGKPSKIEWFSTH